MIFSFARVTATFSLFSPPVRFQTSEFSVHLPTAILRITNGEDDNVSFITLNVFYIFHEQRLRDLPIESLGGIIQQIENECLLKGVESNNANSLYLAVRRSADE